MLQRSVAALLPPEQHPHTAHRLHARLGPKVTHMPGQLVEH
jgi:hypothetical protein